VRKKPSLHSIENLPQKHPRAANGSPERNSAGRMTRSVANFNPGILIQEHRSQAGSREQHRGDLAVFGDERIMRAARASRRHCPKDGSREREARPLTPSQ